jgi:hypothetical protein
MNRAPKTALPQACDGGGSAEVGRAAKRVGRKQSRPGVGTTDKQRPGEQRARKIEAWCQGKAEKYA